VHNSAPNNQPFMVRQQLRRGSDTGNETIGAANSKGSSGPRFSPGLQAVNVHACSQCGLSHSLGEVATAVVNPSASRVLRTSTHMCSICNKYHRTHSMG
jgi:hypothetical protein